MAKLKSFEEYIADIDSAEEIEDNELELGEPETAVGGDEVVSNDQGADDVQVADKTAGEEAGKEVEDMEPAENEVEVEVSVNGEEVDTEPENKADEIEDEMDEPSEPESEVTEAEEFAGWIAFYNGKQVEIKKDEAKDLFNAKKLAIKKLNVPKSKEWTVAIAPAVEEAFIYEADGEQDAEVQAKAVAEMLKECYEAAKNEAKAWEADMHDEHTIESYLKENAALVAALAANALKEMKSDIELEAFEATCNELKESYAKKIDEMKEAWSADGEE